MKQPGCLLVYKSDGSLYFTDPPYGLPTRSDDDPQKELQVNGVYRIPGARKAGAPPGRDKLQLVMAGPGGVWIICPGGKHIRTIKVPERVSNVAGATLTA